VVVGIGDPGGRDHRSRLQPNEVDRTNILAPGFFVRHSPNAPSSRLHPQRNFGDWPSGKLYPVTAAQLLPSFTGFLAPIHFSKLAKNWDRGLAALPFGVELILGSAR